MAAPPSTLDAHHPAAPIEVERPDSPVDDAKGGEEKGGLSFPPTASSVSPGGDDGVDEVVEEEPELHARTWLAIGALFALNFVQVFALTGTPAIVSSWDSREEDAHQ